MHLIEILPTVVLFLCSVCAFGQAVGDDPRAVRAYNEIMELRRGMIERGDFIGLLRVYEFFPGSYKSATVWDSLENQRRRDVEMIRERLDVENQAIDRLIDDGKMEAASKLAGEVEAKFPEYILKRSTFADKAKRIREYWKKEGALSEPKANNLPLPHRGNAAYEPKDDILHAAKTGRVADVERLLKNGVNPNLKDSRGYTPLHWAVLSNSKVAVESLIAYGANVNAADQRDQTALHIAVAWRRMDILRLLLDKRADVNAKDASGETPLSLAMLAHNREVVVILINNGANVNQLNRFGSTPLHDAASEGDMALVCLLLESGADIDSRDRLAETPLHNAAAENRKEMVEFLIGKSADVNAKDRHDWCPLHAAASRGATDIAELLIRNGARVNALDDGKPIVRDIAAPRNADDLAKLREGYRRTPLDIAEKRGHKELAELLRQHGGRSGKDMK